PSGQIEDACCLYETIEEATDKVYKPLDQLVRTPFFRYFKVDLYEDCPFWYEDTFCMNRDCGVQSEEDESKIPEKWRANALSSVNDVQEQDDSSHPACSARVSDFCYTPDEASPSAVYVDLARNPERFTGYSGPSAQRVWDTIYKENCFGVAEFFESSGRVKSGVTEVSQAPASMGLLIGPGGSFGSGPTLEPDFEIDNDDENEMCVEKRIFYKLISGLHSSISMHICSEWLNQETGEWGPNLDCFISKLSDYPERVQNIYFLNAVLTRAIARARPLLEAYDTSVEIYLNAARDVRKQENDSQSRQIMNSEAVPPLVKKDKPKNKKNVYAVRFYPTGEYMWANTKEMSALTKQEIENYLNDTSKKREGDLRKGYQVALNPDEWEEEHDRRLADAQAQADDDELEDEETGSKRRRKAPAKGTTKKAKTDASQKKSKSNKADASDAEETEEAKVRSWRHELQRIFLSPEPAKADAMPKADAQIKVIEADDDVSAESITLSKVNKVLKRIIGLETIPEDEKYKIRERSQALYDRFEKILAEASEKDGEKKTNGEEKKENGEKKPEEEQKDDAEVAQATEDTEKKDQTLEKTEGDKKEESDEKSGEGEKKDEEKNEEKKDVEMKEDGKPEAPEEPKEPQEAEQSAVEAPKSGEESAEKPEEKSSAD
ncbi:hypothetical protein E3Q18_02406, partial [Wallemia mellicola]